jgi:hypothetical protein
MRRRTMPHWIRARRAKYVRVQLYKALRRMGYSHTLSRRMRDWTYGHIFQYVHAEGHNCKEQLRDMEFCERVRRMMK